MAHRIGPRLSTALAVGGAVLAAVAQLPVVLGEYRGRSTCAVRPSSCNDEIVVYRIRPDSQYRDSIAIDADKLVHGRPEFMGTLRCGWTAPVLRCPSDEASWVFTLRADTLAGTLTLADGRKFRDVLITRTRSPRPSPP